MYGSLGYIDSGKRAPHREAGFLGMNNNPSRKEFTGARRPEDVALVNGGSNALMERRCVFLEEQDRRHTAEVADLRARLAQTAFAPETVRGTTLRKTLCTADLDATDNREFVEQGTNLVLCYPMQSRNEGETKQVWMRSRTVDPVLATVEYKWVLLFEEMGAGDDQRDIVYVSNFE